MSCLTTRHGMLIGGRSRSQVRSPSTAANQIEALARALAAGQYRHPRAQGVGNDELAARVIEDAQDAELIRVAAYTGLRRGELVALRWHDVDFARHKITVRRALSGTVEANSTKSRRAREVPLPDQAAAALDRLSRRGDFTAPDEYVFVNRFGRRLEPSALRRRFERARDAAGLEPLRFHDLRHTYGIAACRRRDRSRERQGRHGALQNHHDRALPPRAPRKRASTALHTGVRLKRAGTHQSTNPTRPADLTQRVPRLRHRGRRSRDGSVDVAVVHSGTVLLTNAFMRSSATEPRSSP